MKLYTIAACAGAIVGNLILLYLEHAVANGVIG